MKTRSVIFLVIAAIFWSSGGVLIKSVQWNAAAIAGGRSAIAALLMLFIVKKEKIQWSKNLILGALAYAGTVTLFAASNKLTTAANAILLQYTAPIYIALLGAWFLKEKTRALDWVVIFFVLGGMTLFFIDDLEAGGMRGNIFGLLSGICFAFMVIFLRMQKDGSPLHSVFLGNIITALIGAPFMIYEGLPDTKSILGVAALGVFQIGLAYIFYTSAIKHVTAVEGVLIPIIEPVLNPVWVMLVIGEVPGLWAAIGGIIVISAVTFRGIAAAVKAR